MTLPGFDEPTPKYVRPAVTSVRWQAYKGAKLQCADCVIAANESSGGYQLIRPARHVRTEGATQTPLCTAHKVDRMKKQ